MEPEDVATQPSPAQVSQVYQFFSQYIRPKDYVNVYATFPMSGKLWPLQNTFYSFDEDLDK
jgi:hypothetical protein